MPTDRFTPILGPGRSSLQKRASVAVEEHLLEVIRGRRVSGGISSCALRGATRLADDEVDAGLTMLQSELRIWQNSSYRWYPRTEGAA
jgi:hypothetical protein